MWVKPPEARCHTKYKLGTVTKVISEQTMAVDGMPRHVRDLRSAVPPETAPTRAHMYSSVMMRNFRCFLCVEKQRKGLPTVTEK